MAITEDRLTAVDGTAAADTPATSMRVRKRNGTLEPVDVNKIVNAVARASEGLLGVDPMVVSTRTIAALADGATTRELDELSIRTGSLANVHFLRDASELSQRRRAIPMVVAPRSCAWFR